MNTLIQLTTDYFTYKLAEKFLGSNGAKISLVYSLFNYQINNIFQKTLTNGPEVAFSIGGLFFYSELKPKFDKPLIYMTICISLAFIIRSSSVLGWAPLLIFKLV